jgi:hypothetical protein
MVQIHQMGFVNTDKLIQGNLKQQSQLSLALLLSFQ